MNAVIKKYALLKVIVCFIPSLLLVNEIPAQETSSKTTSDFHQTRTSLLNYPPSPKKSQTDTIFDVPIIDAYRWLENMDSQETISWVDAQNQFTDKALRKSSNKINSYVLIDKYSYVKYDNPQKMGNYYYTYAYYNNVSVPALFYQKTLHEDPTIIVDPNFISSIDNILLKSYTVSKDNKCLAYQFSRNGSDWGEIKVVNLKTGNHKNDHLTGVKFSGISWKGDGFYYSKFAKNEENEFCQRVYFHKLGTDQEEDELIFKRKDPDVLFDVKTTTDERYLIISEQNQTSGSGNIFYINFNSEIPTLRPLITRLSGDENITVLDNYGELIIATSFKENNNGMVIAVDPANPRQWKVVIPEYESSLLLDVKLLDDKIIALYQSNRKQMIAFYDYQGELLEALQLPFGFSANGFNGEKSDKEILFSYSSYTQPPVVYILNTETFKMRPLRATVVNFDYKNFETLELEYESFDGTKVPLFIIYKKGLDLSAKNPLLLEAYGGFGSIVTPSFSPGIVHFLFEGGIYAFANIRGGGDNGIAWATAGRGKHKKNSFNDFIAAAEYLIQQNYTSPEKLAITGSSNGGLVVAVAMTQRPDLFKVAVPVVAPCDMLRFEKFTVGRYHTDEYGSVDNPEGFLQLLDYSPYHHIDPETEYPATLIMTSENDDRVPPFHSYKFAAKMQNNPAQKNPVLLRVEEGAGHYGATGSFKKHLRSEAAMYDFILYQLLEE
jgi:prolyl oligopeptidase